MLSELPGGPVIKREGDISLRRERRLSRFFSLPQAGEERFERALFILSRYMKRRIDRRGSEDT